MDVLIKLMLRQGTVRPSNLDYPAFWMEKTRLGLRTDLNSASQKNYFRSFIACLHRDCVLRSAKFAEREHKNTPLFLWALETKLGIGFDFLSAKLTTNSLQALMIP